MELKRVYINYGERDLNNCFLIFGSAKDIEKEYEQLERDGYTPFYNESPKFNYDKNYAILVEQKDSYDTVVTEFLSSYNRGRFSNDIQKCYALCRRSIDKIIERRDSYETIN